MIAVDLWEQNKKNIKGYSKIKHRISNNEKNTTELVTNYEIITSLENIGQGIQMISQAKLFPDHLFVRK